MTVLADSSVLYALADRTDAAHAACRTWLDSAAHEVLVPVTVLAEVSYLLLARLGADAELAFVRSLAAGELPLEPLEPADLQRAVALLDDYRDLAIGFVDASIVAMAERLGVREIATTDHRHFGVVRPRHVERFRLAP